MNPDTRSPIELSRRQEQILALIIRTYTDSPEPVSSKQLVESHQLDVSSATVRNEMARLEEYGLIAAPHKSAGRIPTADGYRYFVRRLLPNGELVETERNHISNRFRELPSVVEHWLREAATTLARTARTASLVTPPIAQTNRFKHIELISIQGRLALMVLVLQDGTVHQRMLNLAEPVPQPELSDAADRINGLCVNLRANAIRLKSLGLPMLEREVTEIAADLMDSTQQVQIVYRKGLSEIISTFPDSEGAQQAVRVFEERAFLSMILSDVLQETDGSPDVQVMIAGEGRWDEINRLSIVMTHYGVPGHMTGTMAVLGPTHLNYGRAISAVRHVSGLMTDMLVNLYEPGEDSAQPSLRDGGDAR